LTAHLPAESIVSIARAIQRTARRREEEDDCIYISDGVGPDDGSPEEDDGSDTDQDEDH
jgi:hypothetical protein